MRIELSTDDLWTLSEDRTSVRLSVPPLQVGGLKELLWVNVDFDSDMVDEMIAHLTVLRSQMLPAPPQAGERN